jgi:hypothetical protein
LVIDICLKKNANTYLNPIGGQNLFNRNQFFEHNLTLLFQQTLDVNYTQFSNNFVPSLSIINVMMFNSKEEINKMINQYTLN